MERYNFHLIENKWQKFWDDNNYFLFTIESLNWQCKLFGPIRVRLANLKFQNQLEEF